MAWDEDSRTGMKLAPTEDIVVFPTVLELKAGDTRSLRLGAVVPFGPIEKTYRVFLEELPAPEKPQARSTVRVLTRVGIPVFLAPVKALEDIRVSPVTLAKAGASVDVENTGNVHLRVDSVRVEGFGQGGAKVFEKQAQGWYMPRRRAQALRGGGPEGRLRQGPQAGRLGEDRQGPGHPGTARDPGRSLRNLKRCARARRHFYCCARRRCGPSRASTSAPISSCSSTTSPATRCWCTCAAPMLPTTRWWRSRT